MSKILNAFKTIKEDLCCNCSQECCQCPYSSEIILVEKALVDYEKMKTIKGTTTFDKELEKLLIDNCPNVAKKLKALEIIEKKDVRISILKLSKDYFEYWAGTYKAEPLEQEEYDLLKEVLL